MLVGLRFYTIGYIVDKTSPARLIKNKTIKLYACLLLRLSAYEKQLIIRDMATRSTPFSSLINSYRRTLVIKLLIKIHKHQHLLTHELVLILPTTFSNSLFPSLFQSY